MNHVYFRLVFPFSRNSIIVESQNHRAESAYLLCKRGRRCRNTEKSNQSPISIKGGIHPGGSNKGESKECSLHQTVKSRSLLLQKHLTKFSRIFSCFAFQKEAIGCCHIWTKSGFRLHNNSVNLQFNRKSFKRRIKKRELFGQAGRKGGGGAFSLDMIDYTIKFK